jgi:hypothetical protein
VLGRRAAFADFQAKMQVPVLVFKVALRSLLDKWFRMESFKWCGRRAVASDNRGKLKAGCSEEVPQSESRSIQPLKYYCFVGACVRMRESRIICSFLPLARFFSPTRSADFFTLRERGSCTRTRNS